MLSLRPENQGVHRRRVTLLEKRSAVNKKDKNREKDKKRREAGLQRILNRRSQSRFSVRTDCLTGKENEDSCNRKENSRSIERRGRRPILKRRNNKQCWRNIEKETSKEGKGFRLESLYTSESDISELQNVGEGPMNTKL